MSLANPIVDIIDVAQEVRRRAHSDGDLERIRAVLDVAHPTALEKTNRAGSSLSRELTLPERVQRLVAERDLAREAERLLRESHKETVARAMRLSAELELLTGVAR